MRDINVKEQDIEIVEFIKCLKEIFRIGEYNLDRYVSGDVFSIKNSPLEDSGELIRKMLMFLPKVIDKKGKVYLTELLQEINHASDNSNFSAWLSDLANNMYKEYMQVEIFRKMDDKEFEKLVLLCMENICIHNLGEEGLKKIQDKIKVNEEELELMKNVLFNYFDLIICQNFSKYTVDMKYYYLLGFEQTKNNILWNAYIKNETMLWSKFMMRKIIKLEKFFEYFMEKDE